MFGQRYENAASEAAVLKIAVSEAAFNHISHAHIQVFALNKPGHVTHHPE